MKERTWLHRLLVIIAAATALSGVALMAVPGVVLDLIGGESTATSRHFFGIVGMFMLLFGSLLFHALLSDRHHPVAVFWCALQKAGAFAAVSIGVVRGLFASFAMLIAVFDLFTAVLIFVYWRSIRDAT